MRRRVPVELTGLSQRMQPSTRQGSLLRQRHLFSQGNRQALRSTSHETQSARCIAHECCSWMHDWASESFISRCLPSQGGGAWISMPHTPHCIAGGMYCRNLEVTMATNAWR